jgi:hypothetical protein
VTVPFWLYVVTVVVLVAVLGVVVGQRDKARRALTVELWQRYLRDKDRG